MQYNASNPDEYIKQIDPVWKDAFVRLRDSIKRSLDIGFIETMQYGMISYVVSKDVFPEGYHVAGDKLLPYISIAAQKRYISVYHMAIYADDRLMDWFVSEWNKRCDYKLDMGKSCIRFKNGSKIPYKLIEELAGKMSAKEWVQLYKKISK
ncbi:DUF1801 domain-containing protein [Spirochaetia bacterium 38H-sp]|uniref:DUF1801 domain-containing protein n=1 Tax=Rarispira pelagica TaxID=3141764 RepID=A0ABU9UE71_9SPIR